MGEPGSVDVLRRLLCEEVDEWRSQYRGGRRSLDIVDPDGAVERALRNLVGYGPLEALLADPDVWEIMVNGPSSIFVKRRTAAGGFHDEVFHDDEHVTRVITKILEDSSASHRKLDPAEGLQDAQLDDGARMHIVHADVSRDGQASERTYSGVRAEVDGDNEPPGHHGYLPAEGGCRRSSWSRARRLTAGAR